MASGDPHNLAYGGCWCGMDHSINIAYTDLSNDERERAARIEDAVRFLLESAPDNPRGFECKVVTSRLLALRALIEEARK